MSVADMSRAAIVCLALCGLMTCTATGQTNWSDPSGHRVQSVRVTPDVQLEVLDWGGTGRTVVLLAGFGNTAHVFDDVAQRLTDCCRVLGITRRGFGRSTHTDDGYDDQRLADDVYAVLQELHIVRPVLVGHSMAGGELTTVGRQHATQVAGLVYLDAIGDLEDDPPADPVWLALQEDLPRSLRDGPQCAPEDRTTFSTFRESVACRIGARLPEAELRNTFAVRPDGGVGAATTPETVRTAVGRGQVFRRDYSGIRAPILAFLQYAETPEQLFGDHAPQDESERAAVGRFVRQGAVVVGRWTTKVQQGNPSAQFVNLPGAGHYLFLTRQADVANRIQTFVRELPRIAN